MCGIHHNRNIPIYVPRAYPFRRVTWAVQVRVGSVVCEFLVDSKAPSVLYVRTALVVILIYTTAAQFSDGRELLFSSIF